MGRKKLPPDLARERPGVAPKTPEWDAWVKEMEDYLGHPVCGRKRRRFMVPCAIPPIRGRDCCRRHGGKNLRGPAHPSWKHGKASMYARLLPEKMGSRLRRVITDPNLLALETDIALLELRQMDLMQAIRDGLDPGEALHAILGHIEDLNVAVAEGNIADIGLAAYEIAEAARGGIGVADSWAEFMRVGEQKRKHVETEGKRLERMQAFLTADEARARDQMLLAVLMRAVSTTVDASAARLILNRVADGISNLSGLPPREAPLLIPTLNGHDEPSPNGG